MTNGVKRVAVLTVSDGVANGVREDLSGKVAVAEIIKLGFSVAEQQVVSDERVLISEVIRDWVIRGTVDLIVSTGGTGLGPRDVAPEAIRELLDCEIPGYGELLRADGLRYTPMAVLSRSFAGTIDKVLVVCLPGNPSAVKDGLKVLSPTLPHVLDLLAGKTKHEG